MISELRGAAERPVVLMIDEVDQASGYKVFLAFQSVILAGVYDIKNLKQRIRRNEKH